MNVQGCYQRKMSFLREELVIIKSFLPHYPSATMVANVIIRAQQRHKLAIKYFTQALEANPFLWEALENLSELGKNRTTHLAGHVSLMQQVRIEL